MSKSSQDMTTPGTFKEAFGVLQRHADTLRRQQEPNIDELVNIVTESVNAYRVCKERIQAVEQALERTLGEAEQEGNLADPDQPGTRASSSSRGTEEEGRSEERANSPPGTAEGRDEFDDDIPF
jgi:exodeoxyribonuclease VII small subunit